MKSLYIFFIALAFIPGGFIISLIILSVNYLLPKFRTKTKGDPKEKNIKNTFVPNCKNEYFSVNSLVFMLRQGFVTISMMPDDVKARVEVELMNIHPELKNKSKISKWKINSYSNDVMEEMK